MSKIRDHQSTQPVIRFKGFTDAWEKRKLGNLAEIVRGASPRPIQDPKWFDSSSEIGWLRIADVTEQNGRIHHLEQHISKAGQEKTRVLTQPHLLLSIAATVGKPLINYVSTGVHDGFLIFLKPKFELEFMYQWLEYFRPYWQKYGQPGSQVNLNSELVRNQSLHLPVVEEQIKIGHFLDKLNNLIAVNQRKGDVLQNLKKGLLQRLFASETSPIPDIRFKGFTDAWEKRKLKELGDTYSGLSGKTKEDFGHGEARYVTYMNVFTNPVADPVGTEAIEIDTKQNEVMKNDVFFTTSSETPEEVGMSSVWPIETRNVYLNSFCFGYRVLNQSSLNFLFIAQQLRSPSFRKRMIILAQGISRYNISKKKVLEIPIFRPSLNEQNKIGYFLSNVDDLIAATQRKGEVLKNLKKALLQKMFV